MSWRFFLVRAVLAVWCQKVCWQQEQGVQKCDQQWGYGSQSQSFCVWIFWGLEVCLDSLDPLQNISFVLIKISWFSHRFYSDSIQILFRFYSDSIQILFRFYSDSIQILFRFYSDSIQILFRFYSDSIQILFILFILIILFLQLDQLVVSQLSGTGRFFLLFGSANGAPAGLDLSRQDWHVLERTWRSPLEAEGSKATRSNGKEKHHLNPLKSS